MISVVIPAFNAGEFIGRTIDSVLAQTYRDYEIIVVDDGSIDKTAESVRQYGSKVKYIYQKNAGDGPARNSGIAIARGKWVAFVDHDDEWLKQKLELQMGLLERNPQLQWCGANYYKTYGKREAVVGNVVSLRKAIDSKEYFENFFTAVQDKGCKLITTTLIVRKEVFEQVGVFDSCWLRCADLDMWWRIAYRYPEIGYIPEPLAVVHLNIENSVSRKLRLLTKQGRDARKLIAKHLKLAQEHDVLEEFRPLAREIIRNRLLTTLYCGFREDARAIVKEYSYFFSWYWQFGIYLLTIIPKFTSNVARSLVYLADKFGIVRQVARRLAHTINGIRIHNQ